MENSKCKICRRLGIKLFLKGERCFSQKCPMIKRPYPPGVTGKRRKRPLSEYGKELKEKQKLKNWYHLEERQFKKYVKGVLKKRGKVEDVGALLIIILETRLDNVIFQLGFTPSRLQARQLISHGQFLINDKKVDIPSYQVKKGDRINISPLSLQKKNIFKNLPTLLKKQRLPAWLELNLEKLEGKVLRFPALEEVMPPAELSSIFEFYSR